MKKDHNNNDSGFVGDIFRRATSFIPSGVAILAWCEANDSPFGLTVSTLTPVSVDPPLVSVCIDRRSGNLPLFQRVEPFSINLLAHDQGELARHFGTPGTRRFKDLGWRKAEGGTPIIEGVVAVILCEFAKQVEAGDHQIVI